MKNLMLVSLILLVLELTACGRVTAHRPFPARIINGTVMNQSGRFSFANDIGNDACFPVNGTFVRHNATAASDALTVYSDNTDCTNQVNALCNMTNQSECNLSNGSVLIVDFYFESPYPSIPDGFYLLVF